MCSTIWAYQFCYQGNILGFRPPPYWKLFRPPLVFHFDICQQCFICMIQQAYNYVNSTLWPCLTFSSWKSPTYWNQVGGDWKRVSCHGNGIFFSQRCVYLKAIGLPKFQCFALQIVQDSSIYKLNIILGWVYDVISCLICILPIFQT